MCSTHFRKLPVNMCVRLQHAVWCVWLMASTSTCACTFMLCKCINVNTHWRGHILHPGNHLCVPVRECHLWTSGAYALNISFIRSHNNSGVGCVAGTSCEPGIAARTWNFRQHICHDTMQLSHGVSVTEILYALKFILGILGHMLVASSLVAPAPTTITEWTRK